MDDFELLRRFLVERTEVPTLRDHVCHRLMSALTSVGSRAAGHADVAILTRHVLRQEDARQRLASRSAPPPLELVVPTTAPWPTQQQWGDFGLGATPAMDGRLRVHAEPWLPDWMALVGNDSPDEAAVAGVHRRQQRPVDGDPFLEAAHRQKYLCSGQRAAIRALLTAPAGSTLLVNLPTGAGKSLCAQLPALLGREALSVVVVPTTALCIDQERALRTIIPHPIAYYSGNEQRNIEIRQRIREGIQQIVITSPEAFAQSLCRSLYIAAEAGQLHWIVIDEAHIVDQWGDQFRPAFQELAGIRLDLLRRGQGKALRTALLSATITPTSAETLETLFGSPGPFEMISAVQLRPEPSYWFSHSPGELGAAKVVQERRIMEALRRLPRPLILYTTLVEHANSWHRQLLAAGFRRIDLVTGKTPSSQREDVLSRWRAAQTDLVVATSAFGLGVDQPNIRAVVHACVPENLDRFYQEVGRGGRDGRACISVAVYTDEDLETARGINKKAIITPAKGRERWLAMFRNKKPVGRDRFAVSIDSAPRFGMRNEYNEGWNSRTLTLMARARLIDLEALPPPTAEEIGAAPPPEGVLQPVEAWEAFRTRRVVRILEQRHEDEDVWETIVERARRHTFRRSVRNFGLMERALDGRECIADTLAEMYTIPGRVAVARACGGCPFCRRTGRPPYCQEAPPAPPIWKSISCTDELRRLMHDSNALAIFYRDTDLSNWRQRLLPVVEWLIGQGVLNLVIPSTLYPDMRAHFGTLRQVLFLNRTEEFDPMWLPRCPTVVVHPMRHAVPTARYLPGPTASPRILFFPVDAADPDKPHSPLEPLIPCPRYGLDEFRMELGL